MKLLQHWGVRLGVFSSALASFWVGMVPQSLALPQEQIVQKLQQVPVFTIADENGSPLVASGDNDSRVTGVFMSQQDAQEFIGRLKEEKPDLGEQVQVIALSLGEVYQLEQENQQNGEGLNFAYVPREEQVNSAVSLLEEQGEQVENFQGVPLFIARSSQDEGYLTVEQNGEQIIPLFFEKQQLQGMLDQFKESQPEQADSVQIDVITLEGMVQTLEEQDNQDLEQVVLVPSQESLQFIESVQQQQQQQPQQQQQQQQQQQ
ncbi:MAG: Tic22 family protein [Halothece sp.]